MPRLRRVVLDVDKAIKEPSLFVLAEELGNVSGVAAVNVTVNEMDLEVMGLIIIVEGDGFSFDDLEDAIEGAGAVVHSVDQIVAGEHTIELAVPRMR